MRALGFILFIVLVFGQMAKRNNLISEEMMGEGGVPSQTAPDKQAKSDWIEAIFQTRSWTKVQSLESKDIKRGFEAMKAHLDAGKTPADLIGQAQA